MVANILATSSILLEKPHSLSYQEHILKNLRFAQPDDYIFFSDPDEIPNPQIFKNFNLVKKYGIFFLV